MRVSTLVGASALTLVACATSTLTAQTLIDFETITADIYDSLQIDAGGVTVDVTREDGTDRRLGILNTSFPGGSDNGNDEDLFNSPLSGDLIEVDVNGVETITSGVSLDLGNVLFGQRRDADDDTDTPNDDRRGASLLFSFTPTLDLLTELILVDSEEEGATVTISFASAPDEQLILPSGGDNNSARIYSLEFGPGVESVSVVFNGSGAVGSLEFFSGGEIPEPAHAAALFGVAILAFGLLRRRFTR